MLQFQQLKNYVPRESKCECLVRTLCFVEITLGSIFCLDKILANDLKLCTFLSYKSETRIIGKAFQYSMQRECNRNSVLRVSWIRVRWYDIMKTSFHKSIWSILVSLFWIEAFLWMEYKVCLWFIFLSCIHVFIISMLSSKEGKRMVKWSM